MPHTIETAATMGSVKRSWTGRKANWRANDWRSRTLSGFNAWREWSPVMRRRCRTSCVRRTVGRDSRIASSNMVKIPVTMAAT